MARYSRFNFVCDENERQAIAELAFCLQRSQSDAIRFVVIEAARQLSESFPARVDPSPLGETVPTATKRKPKTIPQPIPQPA